MLHVKPHLLNSWKDHIGRWQNCKRCNQVCGPKVFGDGKLPCDVLFVVSHPEAADVFNGTLLRSGPVKDLWTALRKRLQERAGVFSWYAVSLVACQPYVVVDDQPTQESRLPDDTEVDNCSARLHEVLRLSSPKKIIALGNGPAKTVKGWFGKKSTGLGFLLPETWHKDLSLEHVHLSGGEETLTGKKWIVRVASYLKGCVDAG